VQEIIQHEQTGLLAEFDDVEGLTRQALSVLDDPGEFRPLAEAGVRLIEEKYSLARTAPQLLDLLHRAIRGEDLPPGGTPPGAAP